MLCLGLLTVPSAYTTHTHTYTHTSPHHTHPSSTPRTWPTSNWGPWSRTCCPPARSCPSSAPSSELGPACLPKFQRARKATGLSLVRSLTGVHLRRFVHHLRLGVPPYLPYKRPARTRTSHGLAHSSSAQHLVEGGAPTHILTSAKRTRRRPTRFNNLTTDSFSFRLEYNTSARHGLPPGHVGGPVVAEYDISGVKGAIERWGAAPFAALTASLARPPLRPGCLLRVFCPYTPFLWHYLPLHALPVYHALGAVKTPPLTHHTRRPPPPHPPPHKSQRQATGQNPRPPLLPPNKFR